MQRSIPKVQHKLNPHGYYLDEVKVTFPHPATSNQIKLMEELIK